MPKGGSRMKAMKKWMAWLFVFVFLVSAIGCSGGGENSSTAGDTSAVSDSDTGGSSAEESQAEVKEGNSWEWEAAEGITLTYFYDKLVPSAGFDGYGKGLCEPEDHRGHRSQSGISVSSG
ncbi:MAG: hypothetical protein ACLU60_08340 [Faecalimonas sp.]